MSKIRKIAILTLIGLFSGYSVHAVGPFGQVAGFHGLKNSKNESHLATTLVGTGLTSLLFIKAFPKVNRLGIIGVSFIGFQGLLSQSHKKGSLAHYNKKAEVSSKK